MSDVELYAQPYAFDEKGFQFDSLEDYESKFRKNLPTEEYEIIFLDGSDEARELFNAMAVKHPGDVEEYFNNLDSFEMLSEYEQAAAFYAMTELNQDCHYAILQAKRGDINVIEGDEKDYADNLIDSLGGPAELGKKTLETYFDYEAFGRDVKIDLDTEDEDDAHILEMSDADAGFYVFENWGEPSKRIMERYFDMDAFARDLRLGGDVSSFEYAGRTWTTDYR